MACALIQNGNVLETWEGVPPSGYALPNGITFSTFPMPVPWAGPDGYELVPATFDTPPVNSVEVPPARGAIVSGAVQITRTWVQAPLCVPFSVTNAQARAVMLGMQSPTDAAKTFFQVIDEYCTAQGGVINMAWNWVNDFTRTGAMVEQVLKAQFSMTDAQIDALFIQAATIKF